MVNVEQNKCYGTNGTSDVEQIRTNNAKQIEQKLNSKWCTYNNHQTLVIFLTYINNLEK